MKTEVNKKSKTWTFSIANFKKNANSFLLLTGATWMLASCTDSNLDVVTEVQNQFENIQAVEVDAGFLDVTYTGNKNQTSVNLDGLIRACSNAYSNTYEVEEDVLKVKVVRNGGRIGNFRSEGHITLIGPKHVFLRSGKNY